MRPALVLILATALLTFGCANPAANKPKATVGNAAPEAPSSKSANAETLPITPENSKIDFVAAKVTRSHDGSFKRFNGTIELVDNAPEKSRVSIDIEANSVLTDENDLTKHLQTPDFFDVAKFPKATFTSTRIEPVAGSNYNVTGNFDLHGIKKAITFPAMIQVAPDKVTLNAEFSINRKDWGLTYPGKADDLIRDGVVIKLSVNAPRKNRMVNQAVAYYHELLQDGDLAQRSLSLLDEGFERAKLIFGGRRLSPYLRPHFVSEEDFTQVVRVCETVWSAIEKVKDAAVDNESLLGELGLTAVERELVKIDPGYRAVSPTARLDSFLTDETYSFVELNGESPAGIAYADAAFEIFQQLPVMKRFAQKYQVQRFKGRTLMLKVLLECFEEFLGRKPDRPPRIAIVDLKGLPTQKEFELFREYFESQGCPSLIASPDELEFTNGRLRARDFEIDIVYKRLLVNEYLPISKEQPALMDAYRARAVCMVNSFRSKIIHKKALFAVLTDARFKSLFTGEEQTMIAGHIPWTRRLRAGKSDYYGDEIDLLEFVSDRRERLVLKPNDDYGGHGIYIGWNIDEIGWDEALHNALANGDYLVQERVQTAREIFPALTADDTIQFVEQLVDLDPLLFNGKVGSAFTRLSSNELANVTAGGGMVPTFVIIKK